MHARWLVTCALLLSCSSDPAPAPKPTPAAPAAAPPPSIPKNPTDAVYLGTGNGLVRVDHGKATTLVTSKYAVTSIVIDAKGVVYASGIGGAWSIDHDKVTPMSEPRPNRYHKHLAIGPEGELWTIDNDGVNRWARNAWTSFPRSTFGDVWPGAIAVDAVGGAWVASSDFLWRFDGTSWTKLDNKFTGTKEPYYRAIVAMPSGAVYVASSAGVFVNEKDAWRKVPMIPRGSYLSIDELAIGPDDRIAGSGNVGDVVLRAPGAESRQLSLKKLGVKARDMDVRAVDDAGRTWLSTDNGVVVLDGDGKLLQQWLPGTVDGLTGKVEALATVGKGPTLPTLTSAARGTVVGKVVAKGKPVGGAAVEICPGPASIALFEKTPCTGAPLVRTGVTAADGTFKIADVPVGSYGFAVMPKRTWFVSSWGPDLCCTELENGQVYDIGAITLDKLE